MKILIVSDTHAHHNNLIEAVNRTGYIDMAIHLGDAQGYEKEIQSIVGCPLYIVRGNNDWFSELDREIDVYIGKYKTLLTHGHTYYVSVGLENLIEEGIARGYDIVMFGHTHVPIIKYYDNITIINPGSISHPRQFGRRPSYIIMELDKDGIAHYTINYL